MERKSRTDRISGEDIGATRKEILEGGMDSRNDLMKMRRKRGRPHDGVRGTQPDIACSERGRLPYHERDDMKVQKGKSSSGPSIPS